MIPSPLVGEGNASKACEGEGKATKQEIVFYLRLFLRRKIATLPARAKARSTSPTKGRGGEIILIC